MWVSSYVKDAAADGTDASNGYDDPEDLVAALYSGPKAAFLPTHNAAVDAANALGEDVCVTACRTIVPVYRKHVFAEFRPVREGVEARLALGEESPAGGDGAGRLRPRTDRNAGERLSHCVLLRTPADVDAAFRAWLAQAYALGAGTTKRTAAVVVPDDLAAGIAASPAARATWERCTDAMRRAFTDWVTAAKQAETRARRVERAVAVLASGKRTVY
jgi:hypothetical protein